MWINPDQFAIIISQESQEEESEMDSHDGAPRVSAPGERPGIGNSSRVKGLSWDWIPGMASAWEVMVAQDPGVFLLPVTCLGFHLCRTTSSMASSLQPALLRSQLCHAHPLPEAPTPLQRGPGKSQDERHQGSPLSLTIKSRTLELITLAKRPQVEDSAVFTSVPKCT